MNSFLPESCVRNALRQGIATLRDKNVPSYTLAAELLLLHTLGRSRTWLYAHPEEPLSETQTQAFSSLLARRAAGEPTQYLTGRQEFWGLEFEVTPDVLIPRPETEHVVEVALDRLAVRESRAGRKLTLTGEGLQIVDVGTGSGCIAIALAQELPGARFTATDVSGAALAVAKRNAARHSLADCVLFIESNLFCAFAADVGEKTSVATVHQAATGFGTRAARKSQAASNQARLFDLVVSNPPYIGRKEKGTLMREVREHEPEVALYGGEEGYEFYARLIAQAVHHVQPGGLLVLELGHNSLPAVQSLLDLPHWTSVGVTSDLAGIPRVIAAERTEAARTVALQDEA